MTYLTGNDYPHLCEECRARVDDAASWAAEGEAAECPDHEDPERACMRVYDSQAFCGGSECVGGREALQDHIRHSILYGARSYTDLEDDLCQEFGGAPTPRYMIREALWALKRRDLGGNAVNRILDPTLGEEAAG